MNDSLLMPRAAYEAMLGVWWREAVRPGGDDVLLLRIIAYRAGQHAIAFSQQRASEIAALRRRLREAPTLA